MFQSKRKFLFIQDQTRSMKGFEGKVFYRMMKQIIGYKSFDESDYLYIVGLYRVPKNSFLDGIVRRIQKIHLSTRIDLMLKKFHLGLPFKGIYPLAPELDTKNFSNKDIEYYVICCDFRIYKKFMKRMKELRKLGNVKFVFYSLDPMSHTISGKRIDKAGFDLQIHHSPEEAQRLNIPCLQQPMSDFDLPKANAKWDIMFIGSSTGARLDFLKRLRDLLEENSMISHFVIPNTSNANKIEGTNSDNNYQLKSTKPFPDDIRKKQGTDYLQLFSNSNVILDISRFTNITNLSPRYMEAVISNKKYLCNNPEIVHQKYYNPQFVKFFTSIDDFTPQLLDWIKDSSPVDYKYDGQFSPKAWLEEVASLVRTKTSH